MATSLSEGFKLLSSMGPEYESLFTEGGEGQRRNKYYDAADQLFNQLAVQQGFDIVPVGEYNEGFGGQYQQTPEGQKFIEGLKAQGYTTAVKPTGADKFDLVVLDPTGKEVMRQSFDESGVDFALQLAALVGLPFAAEAAGLFGTEAALGSAGIGGAEGAAFADLAGGMIPEFGTTAAYNAAINPATLAGTALSTGITPEAIATGEAALAGTETAPYVMSSADKAALYGSEAAYGPGMTGTQTAAYDAVLSATGSKDLANIAANVAGTVSPSTLSKLIPSLITAATAPGLLTSNQGAPGNLTAPTQGVPTSSPEYYNAIQQYYNSYMPNAPRDVSGPLQQWYEGSYGASTGQGGQPNVSAPGRPTMRPMSAGGTQAAQQTAPTQSPNQILFNEYMSGYQDTSGFGDRDRQVLGLLSKQNPELFAAFTADPTLYNAAYGGQYSSISPERQEAKQRAAPMAEQARNLQRILARNSDIDFDNPAAVANAFADLAQQAQLYQATGMSPESGGLLRSYAQPLRGAALAGDLAAGRLNYDQAMNISRYQDAQQGLDQARSQLAAYNASVQAGQRPEQAGYAENLQRIISMNEGQIQKYAPTFTGVDMAALDYNRLNTPQDILDFAQRAGVGTQAASLFTPTGG